MDTISKAATGFIIGAVADVFLVRLGFPKHTAKTLGSILAALAD